MVMAEKGGRKKKGERKKNAKPFFSVKYRVYFYT